MVPRGVQVRILSWAHYSRVSHWFTRLFYLRCVKNVSFFPLSTTISDTKLTHQMTHHFTGTTTLPHQHAHVDNFIKKGPSTPCLTHHLTHPMTHRFGSHYSAETSVLTRVSEECRNKIFFSFFITFSHFTFFVSKTGTHSDTPALNGIFIEPLTYHF